jgi:formate dehydrogenase iron-sulfur subunit
MVGCPFGIPKYEWDKALPRVQKCIFCHEKRLRAGKQPACTEVCPAKATVFGDRDDLIHEARQRIQANPGRYVDRIYGLEEAGGTSVLYLSGVPFEQLGFPSQVRREPYPRLTWEILSKIPDLGLTGGACLLGLWWIINRRMENDRMNVLLKSGARASHAAGSPHSETGTPGKEGRG